MKFENDPITILGAGDARPRLLAGRRILVADDNPVNRQIAAELLEKLGCAVDVAEDGLEVLAMHAATRYDLVLMDCEMPRMDGYHATRRIRMTEQGANRTPIVALTVASSDAEREKCLAAGMDDFLSKPIRLQVLQDTLLHWLSPQKQAQQHVSTSVPEDELEAVREMFGTAFPEIVALYHNDSPPRIVALWEALTENDLEKLAKIAHVFGGSSASIGATGLAAQCNELEHRVKAGLMDDMEQRIASIETEYRRVAGKLQQMIYS